MGTTILGQVNIMLRQSRLVLGLLLTRERWCLANISEGITNNLVTNQMHAKSFEVADILTWLAAINAYFTLPSCDEYHHNFTKHTCPSQIAIKTSLAWT